MRSRRTDVSIAEHGGRGSGDGAEQRALGSETLLMSAADLAEEFRVSTRTIRRLDQEGRLPRGIRIGHRARRWRRAEIVAWVAVGGPPRDEWDWEAEGR